MELTSKPSLGPKNLTLLKQHCARWSYAAPRLSHVWNWSLPTPKQSIFQQQCAYPVSSQLSLVNLTGHRLAWIALPAAVDLIVRAARSRTSRDSVEVAGCFRRLIELVAPRFKGAGSIRDLLEDVRIRVSAAPHHRQTNVLLEVKGEEASRSNTPLTIATRASALDLLKTAIQLLDLDLAHGNSFQ